MSSPAVFTPSPDPMPPQYIELTRDTVKRWIVVKAIRSNYRRVYVECLYEPFSDSPIRYDDGAIAYEWPERVPEYVKLAVARHMAAGWHGWITPAESWKEIEAAGVQVKK